MPIPPLRWNDGARRIDLLDQTRLPVEEVWLPIADVRTLAEAIRLLRVRGAPAIGIAAAYGVVLSVRQGGGREAAYAAADELATTRPTAVNLFWALDRMRAAIARADTDTLFDTLLAEARAVEAEDMAAGRAIGLHGRGLLTDAENVLTHCHAGGVATSGYGTALAPIHRAHEDGQPLHVWVDETRPLLQGARITAWELDQAGVPCTLITDSMAAHVMQQGRVDAIIVGADRIAANGDVANKIGTYGLAVLARAHGLPFYVAAPVSTFDRATASGAEIAIEERASHEVTHGFGRQTGPTDVQVYNPAFDVTPHTLVTAMVTEQGVVRPPFEEAIAAMTSVLRNSATTATS